MNSDMPVKGTCMLMCPMSELEMREREGLLHPLECRRERVGRSRGWKGKADRDRVVKAFCRSGPGRDLLRPESLRPAPVLRNTVCYLITVACEAKSGWLAVHEFVSDRLRAVRQDAVVQRLPPADSAELLEPMVRFHAYSAYRLCEEGPRSTFNPYFNRTWLNETLKQVLVCYDETHANAPRSHKSQSSAAADQMEALYGVLHLGNVDVLQRLLSLDPPRGSLAHAVLRMSLAHLLNNFDVVCRSLHRLPPLLACVVAAFHLPQIRRRALRAMSSAYRLSYPVEQLAALLLYEDCADAADECRRCGLVVSADTVTFAKATFNCHAKQSPPKRLAFIDDAISNVRDVLMP